MPGGRSIPAGCCTVKGELICGDCLDFLAGTSRKWTAIFADPPDNIGLGYTGYRDRLPESQYLDLMARWLGCFVEKAGTVWASVNARWVFHVGRIVTDLLGKNPGLQARLCVQSFTFGQCQQTDLANCYRPLLRLRWPDAPLYPDAIRVPSWRQENGDKRADPRGRVPGDVFEFPRVTGNSKQRRAWHPTQLNEGLVERCLRSTTAAGDSVLDPFAGTGTTLRVCRRIGRDCTLVEVDPAYCERIAAEHGLPMLNRAPSPGEPADAKPRP